MGPGFRIYQTPISELADTLRLYFATWQLMFYAIFGMFVMFAHQEWKIRLFWEVILVLFFSILTPILSRLLTKNGNGFGAGICNVKALKIIFEFKKKSFWMLLGSPIFVYVSLCVIEDKNSGSYLLFGMIFPVLLQLIGIASLHVSVSKKQEDVKIFIEEIT